MRFPREKNWQGKPFMGTRDNGGFTSADLKTPGTQFRNHAVHINGDGLVKLAANDERIDGFFVQFDGGDIVEYRDTSKGSWARNGTDSAINIGARLVGAQRAVSDTDKPTHGYVKAVDETVNLQLAKALNNIVRAPKGAAHTTLTSYPPADVVVEHGIASSD